MVSSDHDGADVDSQPGLLRRGLTARTPSARTPDPNLFCTSPPPWFAQSFDSVQRTLRCFISITANYCLKTMVSFSFGILTRRTPDEVCPQ
jgi:hypothetical protein